MSKDLKKKIDYWAIGIVLVPFFAAGGFAEVMFNFEGESFIKATSGRIFGAAIGALVYFLTLKKSNLIKIIFTILSVGLSYLTIFLLCLVLNTKLMTCEICGYKAIKEKETQCGFCEVDAFGAEGLKNPYESKDSWLYYEQLYWFESEDEESFDFYKPKKEGRYKKDMDWRPFITKEKIFGK